MTEQSEKNSPSSGKRIVIRLPEGYYDWPEERQLAYLEPLTEALSQGSGRGPSPAIETAVAGSPEEDVRPVKGVYYENDDSPGVVYYFEGGKQFIHNQTSKVWFEGNEFTLDGFARRWRDGWISGPFDNPPKGVPPCSGVEEVTGRVRRDVGGKVKLAAEDAPVKAAPVDREAPPEQLWNEAVQALVRCDAAEFLSETYMAESRTAQDLFEQAAVGFSEAGNTEMATEAAQVVARLARFNSLDWGDPADVETSNEEPVYAEDGITLLPPGARVTPPEA